MTHPAVSRHSSSSERLAQYNERTTGVTEHDIKYVVPALATRSYHLPGNSWWEDWRQYMANNHPLFGLCCHHRLHPIGFKMRIVHLIGSIMFGLAITNLLWLLYLYGDTSEDPIITIHLNSSIPIESVQWKESDVSVTATMIKVWTIGGALHAIFDLTVWYATACVCCLPGQFCEGLQYLRWMGNYLVVFSVLVCTAIATFIVVLRATIETSDAQVDLSRISNGAVADDEVSFGQVNGAAAYEFLLSYVVVVLLAFLFYYPFVGTIFFSGILTWGHFPVLGGRPFEVRMEETKKRRQSTGSNSSHTDPQKMEVDGEP